MSNSPYLIKMIEQERALVEYLMLRLEDLMEFKARMLPRFPDLVVPGMGEATRALILANMRKRACMASPKTRPIEVRITELEVTTQALEDAKGKCNNYRVLIQLCDPKIVESTDTALLLLNRSEQEACKKLLLALTDAFDAEELTEPELLPHKLALMVLNHPVAFSTLLNGEEDKSPYSRAAALVSLTELLQQTLFKLNNDHADKLYDILVELAKKHNN